MKKQNYFQNKYPGTNVKAVVIRYIVKIFRNVIVKPFGLKGEKNLSDLVIVESDSLATISKSDKHGSIRNHGANLTNAL